MIYFVQVVIVNLNLSSSNFIVTTLTQFSFKLKKRERVKDVQPRFRYLVCYMLHNHTDEVCDVPGSTEMVQLIL